VNAVEAEGLGFRYGSRQALAELSFAVPAGQVHAFLGPNGSGKSTLFKLLATAYPLQQGRASLLGLDLHRDRDALRRRLGVVFQSPALDRKLTVRENLWYGGRMYGLGGDDLRARGERMLAQAGLADRAGERVERLSGGLKRRAELAKGLLHEPELLLLDEPSTGLDPGARGDLWQFLRGLRGVTILFTTHLMDEAEQADQVTILHEGRLVASGAPAALRAALGGEVLELATDAPAALARDLAEQLRVGARAVGAAVRIQAPDVAALVPHVMARFGPRIASLTLHPPSLEDVFLERTGHRFWGEA
jgi:ABC-2 type transport system ATP-binding protein